MFKDMEYDLRAILNAGIAYARNIEETKQFLLDVEGIVQNYKNRINQLEMSIVQKYEAEVSKFEKKAKEIVKVSTGTNP